MTWDEIVLMMYKRYQQTLLILLPKAADLLEIAATRYDTTTHRRSQRDQLFRIQCHPTWWKGVS